MDPALLVQYLDDPVHYNQDGHAPGFMEWIRGEFAKAGYALVAAEWPVAKTAYIWVCRERALRDCKEWAEKYREGGIGYTVKGGKIFFLFL